MEKVNLEIVCEVVGDKAPGLEVHHSPNYPWYMPTFEKAAKAFIAFLYPISLPFLWFHAAYPLQGTQHDMLQVLHDLIMVILGFDALFICFVLLILTIYHLFYDMFHVIKHLIPFGFCLSYQPYVFLLSSFAGQGRFTGKSRSVREGGSGGSSQKRDWDSRRTQGGARSVLRGPQSSRSEDRDPCSGSIISLREPCPTSRSLPRGTS